MSTRSVTSDSGAARRFYDRISRAYDFIADASEHALREHGIRALSLAPGERVLEIGFGTGHGLVAITEAVGASGRVYGIDISQGMASIAARRVASEGTPELVLVQGDARSLSFRSASFDAVFLSFTLELFGPAIPFVLREVHRVLHARGRIGIVGLAESAESGPVSDLYLWLHRHVPHLVDCAPTDIARAVNTAGFELAVVEMTRMWTMPVAIVVGRKTS